MSDAKTGGSVSVLIATRLRPEQLTRCLSALAASKPAGLAGEIIALEDGSPAGIQKRVRDIFYAACTGMNAAHKFMVNSSPAGIAAARERLAKAASPDSDFLLYLDDDVYMEPDCLSRLVDCLNSRPGAGIAGPRTVFSDRPEITAHGANYVSRWTGLYGENDPPHRSECDWLLSTCLLVKRAVAAAGLAFEPGFHVTHAEVDFCLRAGNAGYKTIYCPDAVARHDEKPGLFKPDRIYYIYRNKLLVIRRGLHCPGRITALFFTAVFGLFRYILDSILRNKGMNAAELKLIFKAVAHGLAGRMGPL